MDLARVLSSVGKAIFVKYYYSFQSKTREECMNFFEENYTEKAKRTRVGHAKRIFREEKNIEALRLILSSGRVDKETRKKAQEILQAETR